MFRFVMILCMSLFCFCGCIQKSGEGDSSEKDPISDFTIIEYYHSNIITWNVENTADFDRVEVCRSTDVYPSSPVSGFTVYEGLETGFTDTELTAGTEYFYSLFLIDGNDQVIFSISASAIPEGDPEEASDLEVDAADSSVTVSWNPSSNLDGYKLYIKEEDGSFGVPIIISSSSSEQAINDLQNGVEHIFLLTAINILYDYTEIESTGISGAGTPSKILTEVGLLTSNDSTGIDDPHTEASWQLYLRGSEFSWRNILDNLPIGLSNEILLNAVPLISATVWNQGEGIIQVQTNTPLDPGISEIQTIIKGNDGSSRTSIRKISIPSLNLDGIYYEQESAWAGEWSDFPQKILAVKNGSKLEIIDVVNGKVYASCEISSVFSGHSIIPAVFINGILTLNSQTDPLICWECDFNADTLTFISNEDTSNAGVLSGSVLKGGK